VEYQGRRLYVIPVSATEWLKHTTDTNGRIIPTPSLEPHIPPDDWKVYKRVLDWCFVNRDTDFVLEFLDVPSHAVIYHTVKHLTIAAPDKLMLYARDLIHKLTAPNSPRYSCLATDYFLQLLHHVPVSDPDIFHQMVFCVRFINDHPCRAQIIHGLARQKDRYIERALESLKDRSEAERTATERIYKLIAVLSGLPDVSAYFGSVGDPFVPPARALIARMLQPTLI
jgi:hypothetical protein